MNTGKTKNGFPVEDCPYCGEEDCEAEWCDVGVGYQQIGPFHCECCHAFSIGAYDNVVPTAEEKKTGWYKPFRDSLPDTVSTISGIPVDSQTALAMYRKGIVDKVPFHI